MTFTKFLTVGALALGTALPSSAFAQTEIQFWHAMGGRLGEVVEEIATKYNASQSEYTLVPTYKGGYEDTMTAGIAAFRAKEQPNIIQIFDAGAATIINAKGATIPMADLMAEHAGGFDSADYIEGVRYFYADSDGKMIGMPFNSSTPLLYYNKDAFAAAGLENPPATWEEFEEMAPVLKEAGYTALAQSHSPWIFSENFHSRHNLQLATGNKSIIEEPKGTFIGGAALFAMSGKSDEENKGVADFMSFLTSSDMQYFWHKETGYVPITNAAYDQAKADGYYESTPDAEVGILQLTQPGGEWTKGYRLGYYVQIRDVMYKHFDDIFSGEATVDAAFSAMETEANDLLTRFKDTYN